MTSQGFFNRVGDVTVGRVKGVVESGRAMVPLSRRVGGGWTSLAWLEWPFESFSTSEYPRYNLSPCLVSQGQSQVVECLSSGAHFRPTSRNSTPGRSTKRLSRSGSGFELTGLLLSTMEAASVSGGS